MRNKLSVQILNETPLEVKEEVQLNTKQLLENYYATTTPKQVVKELEDLGVEFVRDECWCYRKLKKCKMYMDCLQMNTKTFNNDTTI